MSVVILKVRSRMEQYQFCSNVCRLVLSRCLRPHSTSAPLAHVQNYVRFAADVFAEPTAATKEPKQEAKSASNRRPINVVPLSGKPKIRFGFGLETVFLLWNIPHQNPNLLQHKLARDLECVLRTRAWRSYVHTYEW